MKRRKFFQNGMLAITTVVISDFNSLLNEFIIYRKGSMSLVGMIQHKKAFDRPHDIEIYHNLAFVPGKGGSLAIVDIKNPTKPRLVWYKHDPNLLEDAETVLINKGQLFVGTRDFFSINISQPYKPKIDCHIVDRPRIDSINGMFQIGDFIISANKTGWLGVFDISKLQEVKLHSSYETKSHGLTSPHDIDGWGNYIGVVSQAHNSPVKFQIFKIRNTESGKILFPNEWDLQGALDNRALNGANRLVISGGYAYIACSQSRDQNSTIGFVDIRNPKIPVLLKIVPFKDGRPTGLTIVGKVLFAAGNRTIQAFDVTNPKEPKTLATFQSRKLFPSRIGNAHDLVYKEGYLYVTAQNDHRIGIVYVNDERIRHLAFEN